MTNEAVSTSDHFRPEDSNFYAQFVDDTRQGFWGVFDDNGEGQVILALRPDERDQAEFAVTLLANGGLGDLSGLTIGEIGDELDESLVPVECKVCEKPFFRAQLHDDRCPADLS